jgi:flagellar FliL protein
MARKKKESLGDEIVGAETPKKGKKKLVIVMVLVLVLAGAGYFVMGRGSKAEAAPAPVAGAAVPLEAINLNLAGGHYLKLGLALQATADAKEAPDGSKALDLAIEVFSNKSLAELNSAASRHKAKEDLVKRISKAYDGDVMDVYLTEFVTQ